MSIRTTFTCPTFFQDTITPPIHGPMLFSS